MTRIDPSPVAKKNLAGTGPPNSVMTNPSYIVLFYLTKETQHYYERAKTKPPIPRMNSRTPTKTQ